MVEKSQNYVKVISYLCPIPEGQGTRQADGGDGVLQTQLARIRVSFCWVPSEGLGMQTRVAMLLEVAFFHTLLLCRAMSLRQMNYLFSSPSPVPAINCPPLSIPN